MELTFTVSADNTFKKYVVSSGTWVTLTGTACQPWGGLQYKNGYFYLHAGNGTTPFKRYRVATDTWEDLTDVPDGAVLGSAIYDAYYYCQGSYGGKNLYSYDLGAGEWNNTLTLPFTTNDAAIVTYGTSLYIVQGEAGTGFTRFTPNNPMLTNMESTPLTYSIGDAATNVTTTLTASQNAGINFQSATVSISSNFQSGKDVLSFENANGITGSWDASSGILTLSGTKSIANYQSALRSVKYLNTDATSTNLVRTISYRVYDGSIYSNTSSRNIIIPGPPSVTTADISGITSTSASSGGNVTDDNSSSVTVRGICWNTTGSPTISNSHTSNGSGLGSFTSSMTGLTDKTKYYVRAYATNSYGTNYGSELSFTAQTVACIPSASTNTSYMGITNVTTTGGVTNFNKSSGISATSYANFSSSSLASAAPGTTINMSFTSSGYGLNYAVWIDFNNDATFSSSEQVVSLTNSSLTANTSFVVPTSATIGSHVMRVRADYSGNAIPTNPCSTLSYGETEDYTFEVISSAPAAPVAGSNSYTYDGTSKTATATVETGATVDWYAAASGGATISVPTGTNKGSYSAYAQARNTTTGTISTSRTLVTLVISAKELTVTGATAQSKVYNGNNTATISGATLSGVVGSDNVTLATATSGTFAQPTVGTNIAVTPAMTITGTAIGNYTLTQPTGLKANITAKELTVTGVTASNKVYDGTNSATISGATLSGVVGSDNVVLAAATSGTFVQTTVGTNIAVTPAMTITGTAIGNYTLTQPTGLKANITAKELTVTGATAQSKVYNGNNTATISGATLSGVVGSDNVVLATATSGTFAQTTVGTNIAVTPAMTITGTAIGNYTLIQPTGLKANITAKELTVTGATASNKVYDGTNSATISCATLSGVVGSDNVVLATATSGTFAQTTVGTNIAVTPAMTITGTAIGNYTLTQPTGLKANITAKELTVTGATASNKVYDGTNSATISGATLSGVVGSDNVTLATATSGTFAQSGIGSDIAVTPAMTITGTAIGNYTLTQPTGLKANITAKELTVTGATAQSKVYNGNNTATISGATLSGVVGSDNVVLATATSGTFAQTTVGTNIAVTPAMTITGTAIGNYTLTQPTGLKANITAKELTVTGATAQSKVYNGNNTATISGATLSGVVGSDNVTLATATSGTFAQTTVGTNIAVTPAMTITGTAIGNYTLTQPTGLKANITAKELTVTGATAQSKVYNGNNTATISDATLSGVVSSDNVTLATATSGTFAQTTVGTNIAVTPAMTITGTAIGNYTLTQPTGLKADITAKELTVTGATAQSKVYNGNNTATISGATLSGVVGSDNVVLATATSGTFAQATVGTDIVVTPAMTITGTAIGNYTLTQPTGLKADITAKELTVTGATAQSKVYNGNNTATISGATLSGVVGSDNVVLATATSGTFAQATVGTDIVVTPAMTITGTAIGNYTLTQPTGLKANITAKELTVTGATASNKVYDGTNSATISGATLSGVVGSDNVVLATATSGTFAQATVGTNIAVTPAMTITGTAIGNYTLTQPTGLKANITAKELTVTGATASNKVYDGTNSATISGATLSGVVGSDNVVLATATSGTFAQATVGTNIAVTPAMTITGTAIGNYTLTQPSGLKASIIAKELTVTGATAQSKVYNGNNTVTISGATLSGVVGSDNVTLATATSGTFAQATVGTNIAVTPAMTITGTAIGNYTLTQPTGLKANITAKELTVTGAVAKDKIYNGNNVAMIEGATINGIVGSEEVVLATATEGTFAQTGIGTDIAVTPAMTITGTAIGNYTLTQPTSLKANITAKELTVTDATAQSKVYNGNNVAMIEGATINGIVGSEEVVLATATEGTFAQSGIGTDIAVTPAMTITGAAIGNYTLTQPTGLKANITAKELTVTGAVAKDKIYNGNNVTMIEGATINGIVGSEEVVLATATEGTFAQSGIGTDIAVTPAMTITGAAIGNYTLTQPTGLKANITAKELTVTGAVAKDKIYNGNNVTMIEGATINGIVGSEEVVLATATEGTFAQTGIGTDIAVTPAMTITGTASGNYTLTQPTGLKANITAKELTVTDATAQSKVYNGNNVAMIVGATINGIVGSEEVVLATATEGTFAQTGIGTDIAVTPAMTITGTAIGNYTLTQPTSLKANITAKELTVTDATAQSKVYNGNNVAMIEGATINGIVGSEEVVLATATEGTFAQSGIGTDIAVTPAMTITGAAIGNYTLTQPTGLKANITAKELTVTGAVAKDKIYNGNNVTMIEGATINGIVGSEEVVLATATEGTFAQSGIGTDIAVTPAMTITGTAIGNYTLTQPTGLKANITAKELTVTGAVAKDKIYNGNNVAMIEGATINGIVGSEEVVLATANEGTFAQSGIGTDIAVTPAMTITGTAIGNYTLTQPTGLKANITAKELTVTGVVAKDKIYNGNNVAMIEGATINGIVGSEEVVLATATEGTFAQNGIGTDIAVTPAMTITGTAIGNYTLTQPTGLKANITAKELTVTGAVAKDKIYNGNNVAMIEGATINGIVGSEEVVLATATEGTFAQSGIGTDIAVTPAMTITGTAIGNYTLTQPTGLKANITAKELTVTGAVAKDKIYNGNSVALIEGATINGIVGSEEVVLATATEGTFAQTGIGTDIAVTPAMTITGTAIGNYTLTQPTGLKANITAKELTVTDATAQSKVYNGNNVAMIEGATINGIVGSEEVVLATATEGTFAQSGIGTDIAVTPAMTITGTAIGNYTLSQPTGLKANITAKELTVTGAVAKDKIYNGNNVAMIEGATINGIVGSEEVVLATATEGTFAQSSIGTDIAVTPAMTITGAAIGNYTLTQPTGLKANITAKELIVSEPTIEKAKVYDRDYTAEVIAGFLSNVEPCDTANVSISAVATYSDNNAGENKTITVKYQISGSAAGNYTAPADYTYSAQEVKIEPKQLTITNPIVVTNKLVDGNSLAEITKLGELSGVVDIDTDNLIINAIATYENANVGTGKTITVTYSLSGSAKDNYLAPASFLITDTKISDNVALTPLAVPATAGCEGSDIELAYTVQAGTPTQYKITYDSEAIAAGMKNVDYTNLPSGNQNGTITLAIPVGTAFGTFHGTLQMQNELGTESGRIHIPVYG